MFIANSVYDIQSALLIIHKTVDLPLKRSPQFNFWQIHCIMQCYKKAPMGGAPYLGLKLETL